MSEEQQEERREQRRLPDRFKWAVLALAVIFAAVFLVNYFEIEIVPEPVGYPPATTGDFKGFYTGTKTADNMLFFVFFDHPNLGVAPLYNYRTLNSDTIKLAIYAPDRKSLEVTLESWLSEETENGTRTWSHRAETIQLVIMPGLGLQEIDLPIDHQVRDYRLLYMDEEIWIGQHKTLASHLPAESETLGERAIDRFLYIGGGVLIAFICILISGKLIKRVKVVPHVPPWQALAALIIGGGVLLIGVRWYIMNVALRSAVLTYIPVAGSAFFFGLWILRPDYDQWFFLKLYDMGEIPAVEIWIYEVLQDGDNVLVASEYSWGEFLKGSRNIMRIAAKEGQANWYYTVPSRSSWRFYYIEDLKNDRWGTHVRLAGQHQKKIEAFKADLVAIEDLSKALTDSKLKYVRLKADSKKTAIEEGAKMAEEYLDKILQALGMRDPPKAVEEKKDAQIQQNHV